MNARVTPGTLVDLWDRALDAPPVERAIDALVVGLDLERTVAEALPIGRRDEQLLRLRVRLFGDRFDTVTTCPSCGELIEATFDAGNLRIDEPEVPASSTEVDDWEVVWRLPTSADLRAIADCPDVDAARAGLVERTVLDALGNSGERDPIPDWVLARVIEDMGRADPGAEMRFELVCPWCEHSWNALFDIAEFLWSEIDSAAQRLLEDVGTLAAAFGWSEREILAMGPARRDRYLELAT
jgi:hypothetical protein